MNRKKAVVVFSGGQDSTTCLYAAKHAGFEVHAITFNYGQRHSAEIKAAVQIAAIADVKSHRVVVLGSGFTDGEQTHVLEGTSPLVSDAPLEQYRDHQSLPGGLEKTFVPMRNQLFLTIAANRAYVLGTNVLYTGVSAEDYGGYPDCRESFIRSFAGTSSLGTFTGDDVDGPPMGLDIRTPLMKLTKAASVRYALTLPGCYEALAYTHTSYDGQYPPTGHDHATLLRAKGFEEACVPDPLILRAKLEDKIETLPKTPNYDFNNDEVFDLATRIMDFVDRRQRIPQSRR